MSVVVYSYPNNPRTWKIQIAGAYGGVKVETQAFDLTKDRTPEFYQKFPPGQVPSADTPDGPVFESDAIMKYVARKGGVLYGTTPYEASAIDAWIDWSNNNLTKNITTWYMPIAGYAKFNTATYTAAKEALQKALTVLNNHLLTHTFVFGEGLTIADISIVTTLWALFSKLSDAKFRKPFSNVLRWFNTVVRQPKVLAVIGPVTFSTAEPKPPVEAVEEKPAAAAPKAKNDDEEEDVEVAEAKKKVPNPLDSLPPTRLNLEDWKRFYSNNPIEQAMEWLWSHYERDGWSIWFADYNYNEDNKRLFMTSNLAGGFIQRLDLVRKYAFAVIDILGDESTGIKLAACFLVRGTVLPPELNPGQVNVNGDHVDDCDSYTWRQANVDDEADKKLIAGLFSGDSKYLDKYGNAVCSDIKVLH